jgi:SAM-dependent methyltransferase
VEPQDQSLWCCPLHHGALHAEGDALVAACCGSHFPIVAGIPDLRTQHAAWVDVAKDRERAAALAAAVPEQEVEGSVHWVFGRREGWTSAMVQRRTRRVLEAAARLREEGAGWLRPTRREDGLVLEIGCGPGMFLASLPASVRAVGLDASLEWLVVARRLASASGVRVELAAAFAEALPLGPTAVVAVVALDVLEHVGDQPAMFAEIDRVLVPGGVLAAATPNRFSLAAEPHVYVWGVGWLPRGWQRGYVRWRSGRPYDFVRLVSARELRRMIRQHTSLGARIDPAPIPAGELRAFSPRRRLLGRTYNALLRLGAFRAAALRVGPFFHLIAVKPTASSRA